MSKFVEQVSKLASSSLVKRLLAILITSLTILAFVLFLLKHPQYLTTLKHIRPIIIIEILLLNGLLSIVLTYMYGLMSRLCGAKLSWRENFLLTAYSSIANFFGPLQSGPGVRAVYLKNKHGVRLRDYTLANLIQYAFFALISAGFLFGGSRPWYQALLAIILVGIVSILVLKYYAGKKRVANDQRRFRLDPRAIIGLLLGSLAMVVIVTAYYWIELKAVSPHISVHQAIIYSGAANFALFVSLTPDAIGIRESFLVFTRRLHHLATGVIVAANIIDRAVYLLYLLMLFVFVLIVHAKQKLKLRD